MMNHLNNGFDSFIGRTPNTFSLVAAYPTRTVQFIRKCFESGDKIISNFDIDCCQVYFQGGDSPTLRGTRRAARAIFFRCNKISLNRAGKHFEDRLLCYSARGFSCLLHHQDFRSYPESVLDRTQLDSASGVLKLLVFDRIISNNPEFAATEKRQKTVPWRKGYTAQSLREWFTETGKDFDDDYDSDYDSDDCDADFEPVDLLAVGSDETDWDDPYFEHSGFGDGWKADPPIFDWDMYWKNYRSSLKLTAKWAEKNYRTNMDAKFIHSVLDGPSFCELHTHLPGMGSADWWINVVLKERVYDLRELQSDRFWWFGPRLPKDIDQQVRLKWLEVLKDENLLYFSWDSLISTFEPRTGKLYYEFEGNPIVSDLFPSLFEFFFANRDLQGVPLDKSIKEDFQFETATQILTKDIVVPLTALFQIVGGTEQGVFRFFE
jgi:hypothetical protein